MKPEQHLEEMIDILASLHKYVLIVSTTENVLVDGKSDEIVEDKFQKYSKVGILLSNCTCVYIYRRKLSYKLLLISFILPGGDQMTCARVRGSQRIQSNSERGIDQLTGIVGITED